MRKLEILIAIIILSLGIIFTFSFGSLIAMDHNARILGVPFLFFLIIFCLILIFSESPRARKRIRILLTLYILTLASYSVTILIIRSNTDNVFEYLYIANAGDYSLAEKILNWHCGVGIVLTSFILKLTNNRGKYK